MNVFTRQISQATGIMLQNDACTSVKEMGARLHAKHGLGFGHAIALVTHLSSKMALHDIEISMHNQYQVFAFK